MKNKEIEHTFTVITTPKFRYEPKNKPKPLKITISVFDLFKDFKYKE
jgi:hypothetical protein